jgi:hypothetical protein
MGQIRHRRILGPDDQLERMALALNAENPQAACEVMTDGMRDFTGPSADRSEWRVDDVRYMRGIGVNPFGGGGAMTTSSILVGDDRATASFEDQATLIELERVDGEWRVESLRTG